MPHLSPPNVPSVGLITHHSLEIIWENDLRKANEIMAARTGDERVQVILEQQAVGWSDNWTAVYTGYAGRRDVENLTPGTEYRFRLQFMTDDNKHTDWSPEASFKTIKEPLYADSIHKAILMKNMVLLKQILEKNEAPINAMDKFGMSPLMVAGVNGYIDIVKMLLEFGADVNFQNDLEKTALMMVAFAGNLPLVQLLREHKASYELKDRGGSSALHWACDSKNDELVDWMLVDGADIEARDNSGYTPLHRVVALGSGRDLTHVLVRHRANVNALDNKDKTPLMLAVVNGHPGCVQVLLDAKADITIKNKYGKTVYDMAVAMDRKRVIKCLDEYIEKTGIKPR